MIILCRCCCVLHLKKRGTFSGDHVLLLTSSFCLGDSSTSGLLNPPCPCSRCCSLRALLLCQAVNTCNPRFQEKVEEKRGKIPDRCRPSLGWINPPGARGGYRRQWIDFLTTTYSHPCKSPGKIERREKRRKKKIPSN